ncbi:MAG: tetratricopeptide repeat protein [Proteobacteria bacterium]|nr:tetratricopeptide repeat protein [Pseudomonadota bacterium]
MAAPVTLRIFLASPGDVAEERALAERVFRRLAQRFTGVVDLRVVNWEHEPLFAHTGFQEQMPLPSECDLVVSILWSRLGSRLPAAFAAAGDRPPPTGTEFEIGDALAGFRHHGRPNLLIYRKTAQPKVALDSGDLEERLRQYRDLEAFCQKTFYDGQGAATVAHHNFVDGFDFERRLQEHVGKWLELRLIAAGAVVEGRRWTAGSPFRGLQAFTAEYQDVYFGRGQAIGELIQRIAALEARALPSAADSRLLLIQGMSGSGKTSLVGAGLLPLLNHRPIEGVAIWRALTLRPGEQDAGSGHAASGQFAVLALRLTEALPAAARIGAGVPRLAAELRDNPAAAMARLDTYLAAEAAAHDLAPEHIRLAVYFDQLEEAFSVLGESERTRLFTVICALARLSNVWVIGTIRSDFSHRLEAFGEIVAHLRRTSPYLLLPPRADELADMIREPAAAAGLTFEMRGGVSLDREILRDAMASPESLPLLEYALEQLYEHRDGTLLKWDVYQPAQGEGGLRGSLVAVAEGVVEAAGGASELPAVLRELTAVDESVIATRRYAPLSRFAAGTGVRSLLDRLIAARLCITDMRGSEPVVFFAHEALLQCWPRATRYLREEAALLHQRDELMRDVHTWESHGRGDAWLAAAPGKLAALRQLQQQRLLSDEAAQRFATLSRARARRRRVLRRAAVGAIGGLAVISLLAGISAQRQRDLARQQARTADNVSRFMVSLFQLADPGENQGNRVTVRQVLDRGVQSVGAGLEGEPAVRGSLRSAMGQAYLGLGLYPQAIALLAQAREDLARGQAAPPEVIGNLIAAGKTYNRAGDYKQAEKVLREAVALARQHLDPTSVQRSAAITGLADALVQDDQLDEAQKLCNEALTQDRRRVPPDSRMLAQTLGILGSVYYFKRQLPQAETAFRESLTLSERARGSRDAQTVETLNNLGAAIYDQGRYEESAALLARALPLLRQIYGPDHPQVSFGANNLGRSLLMAGKVRESVPLFEQAFAIDARSKAADHDDVIAPLNSLAMAQIFLGDAKSALTNLRRAEAVARARHHWMLDQVLLNLADARLAVGDVTTADANLREARELLIARYPPADPAPDRPEAWRYAVFENVQAQSLVAHGDATGARALLLKARGVLQQRFGETGYYPLRIAQRLGGLPR